MMDISEKKRIIILSCSRKKKLSKLVLPAIDRYDGPVFKIMRNFLNNYPSEKLRIDIYILSAKFGLIHSDEKIPWYDLKLTEEKANKLNSIVIEQFKQIIDSKNYNDLFLGITNNYLHAFNGFESVIPANLSIEFAEPDLLYRCRQFKEWLYLSGIQSLLDFDDYSR